MPGPGEKENHQFVVDGQKLLCDGQMQSGEGDFIELAGKSRIPEDRVPAAYRQNLPEKASDPAAAGATVEEFSANQIGARAVDAYLYLDGSDLMKKIPVLPTVSFDKLKSLVELQFGPGVVLRFFDGDKKILIDDDNALRRFFSCHQGQRHRILCAKVEANKHRPDSCNPRCSSGSEVVRLVRHDHWTDFPCRGRRVVLPQLTHAMKTEEDLQLAYDEWAGESGKVVNEVVVKGTNTRVTIEYRGRRYKPDVTIFGKESETVLGITAIVVLGDPSTGDSPPGLESFDFNEIASCLHAILSLSLGRTHVYGILTNHRYLVFLKAQRAGTRVEYVVHYSGPFREGILCWLLNASVADLGVKTWEVMIDGQKHILKNHLGSGQHSIGFELEHPAGNPIVVKYFADLTMAVKEREVSDKLKGVAGVTQLADKQPEDPHFVAVTPKGLPFDNAGRQITKEHVTYLRDALQSLHARNLVHNDAAACNIYYLDGKRAVLADLCSVKESSLGADFRTDFFLLRKAVEVLSNSRDLHDFAQFGERKRERDEEEQGGKTASANA
jgi:hypothetical protein